MVAGFFLASSHHVLMYTASHLALPFLVHTSATTITFLSWFVSIRACQYQHLLLMRLRMIATRKTITVVAIPTAQVVMLNVVGDSSAGPCAGAADALAPHSYSYLHC